MRVGSAEFSQAPSSAATSLATEQRHGRVVLVLVGLFILFGTSPILGHHLFAPLSSVLEGKDHLLNVCLIAIHQMVAPLHTTSHVLLGIGVAYAVWDRARASLRLRQTLRVLSVTRPVPSIAWRRAIHDAQSDPSCVRVIRGLPMPAFTAGFLKPRIHIAAELPAVLNHNQLVAVIAHEDAHRRRRDPLRISLLRTLANALFFVPALRRLTDDVSDEAEIAADDAAIRMAKVDPLVLASALVALAEHRPSLIPGTVPFQSRNLLERRVARLIGEDAPATTRLTRGSLVFAAFVLAIIGAAGLVVTHPLNHHEGALSAYSGVTADAVAAKHCDHDGVSAWHHLFCRGRPGAGQAEEGKAGSTASPRPCPHAIAST